MYVLPKGFGGDAVLAGVEHLNAVGEDTREGLLQSAVRAAGLSNTMNDWLVTPGSQNSPAGIVWQREKKRIWRRRQFVYSLTEYGKTLVGQFDQPGRLRRERIAQAQKIGLEVGKLVRIKPKTYAYTFYEDEDRGFRSVLLEAGDNMCTFMGWTSFWGFNDPETGELNARPIVGLHDPSDLINDRIWSVRGQFDAVVLHPSHGQIFTTQAALSTVKR